MRHLKKGRKLNRTKSHRSAMLSNMASSLVFYKRIRTTLQKAKTLSPYVERLITYSKYTDKLHGRRLIMSKILGKNNKKVANLLVDEIGPQYKLFGLAIYKIKVLWLCRYVKGLGWEQEQQPQSTTLNNTSHHQSASKSI